LLQHGWVGLLVLRTAFVIIVLTVGWTLALRSALYAACLYLWIAYFRPEAWAWNDIFTTLNLSYYAGVYLVARTILSGVPIRLTLRNSLLFVILLHSLISTASGVDPEYSYPFWSLFAKTLVVSFLLTVIIQSPADLRLILMVIALSLGFEAAKQGWAQLVLNPGARNDNSVPFLGDNNLVAVGMAMLVPILSALAATATGWQRRALQFLSVGVVYRGLSTYSRGGLLAIAAVGALQFWRSPRKLRAIAAIAIVAAIVVPVLPSEYWSRMNTITAPSDARDVSQQGRLHFWQLAIEIANDHPLIGVGHSAYSRAYNDYDTTGGQFGRYRAVHSAWFGMVSELGYPGLVMFVLIIISSLVACRRVRQSANAGEIPQEMSAYATGLESSLVAFIIGGSFVSFHYNEMLWHFFGLTMALESVAVKEAALARQRVAAAPEPSASSTREPEPELIWG
jgi:probable O-glycosylation ligase (exosortase A-associated)